jgi:4-amino-4-deoxy-L-arabinose transferase-like glycosyltransferase
MNIASFPTPALQRVRKHLPFVLIALAASYRFLDLDFAEIQAWDEALYALRAKSILLFGDWLDQSRHSYGGLYSAAHPPLYIWLTAATMRLFGESVISLRLWSAIFGAGTVVLVYFMHEDRLAGFFSGVVLAACSFFTFYSRQGQLDMSVTFFITAGVFLFRRFEVTARRKWLFLTGAAFGCALMSKIIVGLFLPIILGIHLVLRVRFEKRERRAAEIEWLSVLGIGLLIALPWHLAMLLRHGNDFLHYYFFYHVIERAFRGVEENVVSLGLLFFANQMIVMLGPSAALALWRAKRIDLTHEAFPSLALIAFLVPFLVSSLSLTKLRTYALPMLPPLALLAGQGLSAIWRKDRLHPLAYSGIIVFALWASSQSLRDSVKELFTSLAVKTDLLIATTTAIIFIAVTRRRITGKGVVFLSLASSFLLAIPSPVEYTKSDIAKAAKDFEESDCRSLIYVDRSLPRTSPQVSYYFKGIDLGWEEGYRFVFVGPDDDIGLDDLSGEKAYIILHVHRHPDESRDLDDALRGSARPVLVNEYYHVYALGGGSDPPRGVQ